MAYISSHKNQIKIKPNVAISEIKKYFDSRRVQYNKIIKSQNNDSNSKRQNVSKFYNSSEFRSSKKQSFVTEFKKEK